MRQAIVTRRPMRRAGSVLCVLIVLGVSGCSSSTTAAMQAGDSGSPAFPTVTTAATNPTSTGSEQNAVDARLWKLAVEAAAANGGTVLTADAVKSTHSTAVTVTSGDWVPGEEPVWAIQVKGTSEFVCNICSRPEGAQPPRGRYITVILDATTFESTDSELSNSAADLSKLGTVIHLHG
jgi:hypothetical protein